MTIVANTTLNSRSDMITAIRSMQIDLGRPVCSAIDDQSIAQQVVVLQKYLSTVPAATASGFAFDPAKVQSYIADTALPAAVIFLQTIVGGTTPVLSATPFDLTALTTQPNSFYGTVRLSTYADGQPAIDVIRTNGDTPTTINFKNGTIDIAAAQAVAGPQLFVYVTKHYDQRGTAHLLQPTHAFRPFLWLDGTGLTNGIPHISYDGQNGGATSGTAVGVVSRHMEAAMSLGSQAVSMFFASRNYISNNGSAFASILSGATAFPLGGIITATIAGGSGYTNGTYGTTTAPLALTGGTGTNATATITVAGGAVTAVAIQDSGQNFVVGDVLTIAAASIGGTGSGFTYTITAIGPFATTSASPTVTLGYRNHALQIGDAITIAGAGTINNILMDGKQIVTGRSNLSITFTGATNANATGNGLGGGATGITSLFTFKVQGGLQVKGTASLISGAGQTYSIWPPTSPATLGFTSSASNIILYNAESRSQSRTVASYSLTGATLRVGNSLNDISTSGTDRGGLASQAIAIFNSAISGADAAALATAFKTSLNHLTTFSDMVIFDGDSNMQGTQTTNLQNVSTQIDPLLKRRARILNTGVFGATLTSVIAIGSGRPTTFNAGWTQTTKVYLQEYGTNDLIASRTALQIEADTVTNVGYWKAQGYKVVLRTLLPALSITASKETERLAYNVWVRAHWSDVAGADALSDVEADTRLQNASDTSVYPDGLHLSNTACGWIAAIDAAAINSLLP